jgi:small-conductance mechanosensitive channel
MRIKRARFSVSSVIFCLLTLSLVSGLFASPTCAGDAAIATAPVRVDGNLLFSVRGIMAYPARERASVIASRITEIADDTTVSAETIAPVESEQSTDIMAGDRLIMSVVDADAAPEGVTRQVLAKAYASKIRKAVETYRQDRVSGRILRGAGSALGITVLFIAVILLAGRAFRWFSAAVEARLASKIESLQDKSHDIVRAEWLRAALRVGLQAARITLMLLLFVFYVDLVLSLFPWTRRYTIPLLELVFDPLRNIGSAALGFVPNLVFLIVLAIITRYGLRLLKAFFLGVQRGMIKISGFDVEWALPVYKLTRLGIIAFTVVIAYPYIPGSESPAFKGVSLFLGVVFSLGSSSSISNIVAGYMVIFRRAFRVGDRVRIGQHSGDVIEIRLQATHLRTIKNEEVVVPNSLILSTEVVNYSSLARKGGVILHTSVTIGYDTPWRQVHSLLLMAASRTKGLLHTPEPFVLQTALNDFYVSYELNVRTERPLEMTQIYSDLHQNIQDAFNEHGVQIMSPHYLGDPAQAKIVPQEKWYQAPAKRDESGVDT